MKLRDNKGSITIFVLVGLLFMTSFLIISFGSNVNKSKSAKEQFNILSSIYSKNDGDDNAYKRAYTAIRRRNAQQLNASVENSNTLNLTKTFNDTITDYKIYGNSVQNGTPSPTSPVEVESVGEKTKNIINSYGFSATGISSPDVTRVLSNSYGTTISTTNFENSLTITQAKVSDTSNPTNYNNGYFSIGVSGLEVGKQYTLSFNIDVTNRLIAGQDYFGVMLNGGNPKYQVSLNGKDNSRISVTFTWGLLSGYETRSYIEIRNCGMSFNISKIQLQEGSEATEYEAYGKYKIPVKVSGKNLFDKASSPVYSNNGKVTIEETKTGVKLTNPAVENATGPYYAKIYKIDSVKNIGANTVYISADIKLSGVPRATMILGYCDADGGSRKTITSTYMLEDGTYSASMKVNTQTYADKYLGLWLYSIATSETVTLEEGSYVEYSNLMLSIGQNEYEPYVEPVTTNIYLDEPLRKINDYADYIDFESKTVVRVIDKFVLDGTESYSKSTAAENRFTTYTPKRYKVTTNNPKLLCDRLIYNGKRQVGTIDVSYSSGSGSGVQLVFGMEYNTLEEFKQYLVDEYTNGTPMKVFYILDTPDDPQPIELPELSTFEDYTNIEVLTSVAPSKIEATYYGYTME